MPLSEHEQKILEEIERRLIEEDPGLAKQVSRTSLHTHLSRRIRLAAFAFILGFVVMLGSGLIVYHYLKRLGRDQIQTWKADGRFTLTGMLARLAERFRGNQGKGPGPTESQS